MPVNTKMKLLEDLKPLLDMVGDDGLWGGTAAMRKAKTTYLPMKPAEEQEDYNYRLKNSTLTNFFKKSVKTMAGQLFEEPVTVANTSKYFEDFAENVDLEGRNLHRFAHDVTKLTLRDGLRFIVIDAPSAEGVTNAAEEQAAGIRPYFVEVGINSVLGWKAEIIAGQQVITQFRYMESVSEPVDTWTEKAIEQIRVIEPGIVTLYRKDAKGEWYLYDEIPTSTTFVPVVPLYGGRQGFMDFEPPLIDIAYLNIAHWQSESNQTNILDYSRSPILHHAGAETMPDAEGVKKAVKVGAGALVEDKNPQAKLTYVEPQGAAIEAGRNHGLDLEDKARSMGAEFTAPRKSGDMTATASAIDESGDVSDLSALALNIKDSLELAFDMVGEMAGQPFQGDVTMNTDLGIMSTPINVPEVVKMRAQRDISLEGMYELLNEEWGTELNYEKEQARLSMEGPADGELNDGLGNAAPQT